MKSVSISGSSRKGVGRTDAKLNRKQGSIPCVLYGGTEQYHFIVTEIDVEKIITSPEVYIVKLNLDGKEFEAIIQEVQTHTVTDKLIHVDFLQLLPGKPITVKIPVYTTGSSEGVLKGGVLLKKIKKIKLKALAEFIPDRLTLDISKLDIGDSIRVNDLKLDNIDILEVPTAVVVGVRTARAVVETIEGAAPVEGAAPAAAGVPAAAGAPAAGAAPTAAGKEGAKAPEKGAAKPAAKK